MTLAQEEYKIRDNTEELRKITNELKMELGIA